MHGKSPDAKKKTQILHQGASLEVQAAPWSNLLMSFLQTVFFAAQF
jgi:hypothetical protein